MPRRPPSWASPRSSCRSISGECRSAGFCAGWRRSSTTAAPASRPTAWVYGRSPRIRSWRSVRGWRPSGESRTATSGPPTRTGRTPCSRWPTVAPRRSATPSWIPSPRRLGSASGPLCIPPRSSRRSGCCTSPTSTATGNANTPVSERSAGGVATSRSAELYDRALQVLPGGVNSPVRAMQAIGRDPVFIASASGARLTDVDQRSYIDWVSSWGPLILGHADPEVVEAVASAAAGGTSYGAPTEGEVELAEEIHARMPSVEMLRMTSSGTEATMSAIRLARAATGREKILKFAGAYHGHVDGLLAQAGSGLATQGIPASPGVPESAAAATVIVPWNDPAAVRRAAAEHSLAAILAE